jgi:cytochrome c oxidase subunit I+III
MATVERRRPVYLDVSRFAQHAFGSRDLLWWGNAGFMVIEGTMFAMVLATLFYLRSYTHDWPPNPWTPPSLFWGTLNLAILLASLFPKRRLQKSAEALDAPRMRRWILIADLFGLAFCVVRGFELAHLNVRWDSNAYGSIVWLVFGLHTTHLLTDFLETCVLTGFVIKEVDSRRFVDVVEDCVYWDFVVLAWLPFYFVMYVMPRLW